MEFEQMNTEQRLAYLEGVSQRLGDVLSGPHNEIKAYAEKLEPLHWEAVRVAATMVANDCNEDIKATSRAIFEVLEQGQAFAYGEVLFVHAQQTKEQLENLLDYDPELKR